MVIVPAGRCKAERRKLFSTIFPWVSSLPTSIFQNPVSYPSVFSDQILNLLSMEQFFLFYLYIEQNPGLLFPYENGFDNYRCEIFLCLLPSLSRSQPNSHIQNPLGAGSEMEICIQKFIGVYSHYRHLWEEKKEAGLGRRRWLLCSHNKVSNYPSGNFEIGVAL